MIVVLVAVVVVVGTVVLLLILFGCLHMPRKSIAQPAQVPIAASAVILGREYRC